MAHHEEILENLIQELRRGSLVVFVLSLMRQKQYGYSLLQNLTDKGMSIEPGTLYPLMRRLEKQGLLDSQWDVEAGRPRKYYLLSTDGVVVLEKMKEEWQQLVQQMNSVLYDQDDA
jgi:DNA-binding PadR family transcriptional regulator